MQFTGQNLQMVRRGIDLAISEIHTQVATCPDVYEYEDEIEALEAEQRQFERLLERIDHAIDRGD